MGPNVLWGEREIYFKKLILVIFAAIFVEPATQKCNSGSFLILISIGGVVHGN